MTYKRKSRKGKVTWAYRFDLPGSCRANRLFAYDGGFATKKAAEDAEAVKRVQIAAAPKSARKTLAGLLSQWMEDQHEQWSPKTAERYKELAAYLSPDVTSLNIGDVTSLILHREWERLAKSGGRHRKTKAPRPLAPKTVSNIAGVVSSAYKWGILYELATVNSATNSKPPSVKKRQGMALAPAQTDLMSQSASGPWCLGAFLEVDSALGARRGEVLALRWADINGNMVHIARSLCQTKAGLFFKGTKMDRERDVEIPEVTLRVLDAHHAEQDAHRAHFGADYRADLDLIFAQPDGNPLKPDSVSSAVSLLCRRLKLPKGASLHTLRHSHGSQLIAAGVPVTEVSERLGHKDARTTLEIYSHAVPNHSKAAEVWAEFQKKETRDKKEVQ